MDNIIFIVCILNAAVALFHLINSDYREKYGWLSAMVGWIVALVWVVL